MPSVCLYFQVHQPARLRRYSIFESDRNYFDGYRNSEICRRVTQKCYIPANRLMLDLIRRHEGRFRLAYSLSGVVLEQFERYAPEVIDSFQELNETGCVEFLAETYYHSLSFLYSRAEFAEQVRLHNEKIWSLFRHRPTVFRNTELIYNNDLAHFMAGLGYGAIFCEGAGSVLGHRSPNHLYSPPGTSGTVLLVRNHQLSDDLAFRFGDRSWPEWPLTTEKYARWIASLNGQGQVVNLCMDYETFGDRHGPDSGILDFLKHMPEKVLKTPGTVFKMPSETAESHPTAGDYDAPHMISWADHERDLSSWLGNAMQSNALHELYRLEREVKAVGDAQLLADWRHLQTSDHFYYMCTSQNGDYRRRVSPYDSPYDSYINFMNVLDNLRLRVGARSREGVQRVRA